MAVRGDKTMTMKEHKPNGVALALLATPLIFNSMNITDVNYAICAGISVFFARYGAFMPDLDIDPKHFKGTRNIHNRVFSTILNMLGSNHRSWQTHCLTITPIPLILALYFTLNSAIGEVNKAFVGWALIGLIIGLFSHFLLDSLTKEGIHIIPNKRFSLLGKEHSLITAENIVVGTTLFGQPKTKKNKALFFIRKLNYVLIFIGIVYNMLFYLKHYQIVDVYRLITVVFGG